MIVIAHRGSSQQAPENTLPAIEKALQDGTEAIEIDVQLTKDEQLVIFHDEWIHRTTNGHGLICELSYDYLQTLDAGSWFHPKFQGAKIPLLSEVLELVKGKSVELHIEMKNNFINYPKIEEKVIQTVQQFALDQQVILSSFRRQSLEICQEIAPQIRRGYLCWSTLLPFFQHWEWGKLSLYSIHPHISLIDGNVTALKQMGYKIFPYVLERKDQLKRCLFYQVDGVFTNSPKHVKHLLERYTQKSYR